MWSPSLSSQKLETLKVLTFGAVKQKCFFLLSCSFQQVLFRHKAKTVSFYNFLTLIWVEIFRDGQFLTSFHREAFPSLEHWSELSFQCCRIIFYLEYKPSWKLLFLWLGSVLWVFIPETIYWPHWLH